MNNFTRLLSFARTNIKKSRKPTNLQSLSSQLHANLSTDRSVSELRKEKFNNVLPGIVNTLLANPKLQDAKYVHDWIKEIFYYNLKGGKHGRGLTTVMAYEILEKPQNITDKNIELSCVVGWCTEMLQSYLLMADDIMDGSLKRRGIPCWYTLPNVGLRAINDSVIIYTTMNFVLRSYIGHLPQYVDLMELFNESSLLTSVGQLLDYTMAQREKSDYSLFTVDRYDAIAKYKTSYYTYKLPVCAGMILANINDEKILKQAEDICFKIGRLFQMQDDFIDVYGFESVTGKIGTDVQEGKCTWLAVTALQLCNETQRKVFMNSYGRPEPVHFDNIKHLYDDLYLPNVYRKEQRMKYDEVVSLVNEFCNTTRLPELFLNLLDKIYNRKK